MMSGSDALSALARRFLLALRSEPLDVDQLAVELGVIPAAVMSELQALIEAGFVQAVRMESGRQAWRLTGPGRSRVAEAAP